MHERIRTSLSALAALATATLAITAAGSGSAAAVTPVTAASKPPAIVSLGDSYISGEAGRWAGNGNSWQWGSAYGTDRAATNCVFSEGWCSHTASIVYGPSNPDDKPGNACDRSDVAEIEGAGWQSVSGLKKINLACSGATSADIISDTFKTEPPQADQLAAVAGTDQVKMIVLSIGGNDLGFSAIMTACVKAYATGAKCSDTQDAVVKQRLATVQTNITNTINKIRGTMSAAGYADSAYTLVVQSYPAPLPYGADFRDPQGNWSRANSGGCPFMDADADWTRETVIPDLAATVRKAAANAANPPVFMDLSWAFNGHELCSSLAQQATSANSLGNQISANNAEWVRWIGLPGSGGSGWARQGDQQEFLHPNAFGQQALSTCLTKLGSALSGSSGREFSCFGAGQGSSPSQESVQAYTSAVPAEKSGSAKTPSGPPTVYQGEVTGGVTGMCLDDYGQSLTPGTPVDMYYCNGSVAQKWSAVGAGTFALEIGGMCADATSTGNGGSVQLNTCTGGPSQAWAVRNGTLFNPNSGRCLDDPSAARTSGTKLQIWDCESDDYAQSWALSPSGPTPGAEPGCTSAAGSAQMAADQCLLPGGSLTQSFNPGAGTGDINGQLTLTYQTDGNLVEYESYDETNCTDTYPIKCGPSIHHKVALWSSNVYGYTNPGEAMLQADGNFVVYNTKGQALWSTQTQHCGSTGCDQDTLKLQSDGNLVIYNPANAAVWATGKFTHL
jgi:hypothetical protein